jgi:hypothetical protein
MNTIEHLELYKNEGKIYSPEIAAILENDIYAMMDFQDSELFLTLPETIKWCQANLDKSSWGSRESVEEYQKSKGICTQ